jgi:hypothetical protein
MLKNKLKPAFSWLLSIIPIIQSYIYYILSLFQLSRHEKPGQNNPATDSPKNAIYATGLSNQDSYNLIPLVLSCIGYWLPFVVCI